MTLSLFIALDFRSGIFRSPIHKKCWGDRKGANSSKKRIFSFSPLFLSLPARTRTTHGGELGSPPVSSTENAAQDIERYTGMTVSGKTQQRLVHRYQFQESECQSKVSEISVDGGKVRLRTENQGEACIWRDYKAVCIYPQSRMAWFQSNNELVQWVNEQNFDQILNCVGDGHPGIWNRNEPVQSSRKK